MKYLYLHFCLVIYREWLTFSASIIQSLLSHIVQMNNDAVAVSEKQHIKDKEYSYPGYYSEVKSRQLLEMIKNQSF